ncbi:MAG: sigma-54-dependent Fis family transcriptional regulator, partial [Candidatus Omnitrophica bacterium]|nr:sigma-54-dependent Fis family transcriptional regulator [Candidatus Omnitrophota bacterium]
MTAETTAATVLIADDNLSELEALTKVLEKAGFRVLPARDGEEGIAQLRAEAVDLIITDLKMPKVSGEELMKTAKALRPDAEIIIITGQGTIDDAVQAIKTGAYDFIEKPIKKLVLLKVVEKALEKQSLARQNLKLSRMVEELRESHALVGRSPNFLKLMETASQAAASEATILIQGESGTGKELVAEFIKDRSPRHSRPFVKINCAAIPDSLLESELFGYEKGAFTGAQSRKLGRFELAHTGTLFLDE